jgi:hypothetical protein
MCEHHLSNIFCILNVSDLPQCGRKDEIKVPAKQFRECLLGTVVAVAREQLPVIFHLFAYNTPLRAQTGQEFRNSRENTVNIPDCRFHLPPVRFSFTLVHQGSRKGAALDAS